MHRLLIAFLALTMLGAAEAPPPPHDRSDACLKCHDGTKANRMESSHPYALDYSAAAAKSQPKLHPPQSPSGFGSTIARDLLVEGNVECSTCHVPHEEETKNPFRMRSRDVVKLCTACHVME